MTTQERMEYAAMRNGEMNCCQAVLVHSPTGSIAESRLRTKSQSAMFFEAIEHDGRAMKRFELQEETR